jgi:hypothetical protein
MADTTAKTQRAKQRQLDEAAAAHDPASTGWDLTYDPRCLWGWGPPTCRHRMGHACFRALGHPGLCGEPGDSTCRRRRPKNWDATGRAEANR